MNPAKVSAEDYIQWLIASPKVVSARQAGRLDPGLVAHDAYTRLLRRLEPNPIELWQEVSPFVPREKGWLIVDDSTLDKPYGPHIALVTRHWSGKHRAVVSGINLITLLWTDGDLAIPIDYRVFNKDTDGLTKNDHLCQMLETARQRGFSPWGVLWDSWYSSLANLKLLRAWGWPLFVGIKSNRQFDPDGEGNRAISELQWTGHSQRAHLKGYGWVDAYRVVRSEDGEELRYFISSHDAALSEAQVQQQREIAAQIENDHRGLKQECHIERCSARKEVSQRNHIGLGIRAFVRLELHRYREGWSRFEAKAEILREAIRAYLRAPRYTLPEPVQPGHSITCPG